MSLRFDHPEHLWLALLAVPLLVVGWRALANADALRRATALGLRAALLAAIAFILAGPRAMRIHDHLTVIGLLDISGSVQRFGAADPRFTLDDLRPRGVEAEQPADRKPPAGPETAPAAELDRRASIIERLRQWFRAATNTKAPDDRFGLVVFDGRAAAIAAPTRTRYVDDNLDTPLAEGTNIADAVRLGLAMFPPDTAKRLVLVTDGNQTVGDVMDAVRRMTGAAEGASGNGGGSAGPARPIPIDVLPIIYHIDNDVQVQRIEAPPTAQPDQTVTVRIIVQATRPTAGRLTLLREGEPVDLSPGAAGASRRVTVPAGQSVHLAQVKLGSTPINRFEAAFEADDPADDALPDNNRAEAFTATPSKGAVLVLDGSGAWAGAARERGEYPLADMLAAAGLNVQVRRASQFPKDLVSLQNYDLVILDNVSADQLRTQQQELLAGYVNDLGGGMIMIGGENGFGAGGWNNTPVASILPVKLDPSKELRLPEAAMVLVLDKSGSMNQHVAGARATQQEVANEAAALAVESLNARSLVGVISFDFGAHVVVPLRRNDDPGAIAQRIRSISPGGGTAFEPPLRAALAMLQSTDAQIKHIVFLSDGMAYDREYQPLIDQMTAQGIKLTTIAVGNQADDEALEAMAASGGGSFYPVRDPRMLPRVLVDSVRVINRPFIKEEPFTPQSLATGSTLTAGMGAAPALGGLVLTAPRDDPKAVIEMIHPEGEPLLAHWQVGLGRVAAFTSEAPGSGAWAQQWVEWTPAQAFWTQLARTISRPPMSGDALLTVTVQDEQLHILYEQQQAGAEPQATSDAESASAAPAPAASTYLRVDGVVYQPDGASMPLRLRQDAPGRYQATIDATQAGNYIVALQPRAGSRALPPVIGGASRATSPEFRRYDSDAQLLSEIAQLTAGRILGPENPVAANLFDRSGIAPSVSMLPVWRTVMWAALALLLLDVASRRLAWDYHMLREAARRLAARAAPAHLRGREAAATLATLRRVSQTVPRLSRRDHAPLPQQRSASPSRSGAAGMDALEPDVALDQLAGQDAHGPAGSDATSSQPEVAPSKVGGAAAGAEPGEQDRSRWTAALDAFLGRAPPSAQPPAPGAEPSQPSAPAGTEADAAERARIAGHLLAAKRRARQRMSPDGGRQA